MNILRKGALLAPICCLVAAVSSQAHDHPQSPTYFGWPGVGPSGPVYKYQHPWTYSMFGFRHSSCEERDRERFDRQYRIAMAEHIAALNRLDHHPGRRAYVNADPRNAVVPVAHCNANYGQGFGAQQQVGNLQHMLHGCKDGNCGGGHGGKGCGGKGCGGGLGGLLGHGGGGGHGGSCANC
ncbi:MAG TPA: hypothetical protein VNC50_20085, partial [Planctomycetia bacterium]|nr:hypothetical protein [Planctomycetia bacterium]